MIICQRERRRIERC